eukprot:1145853-Pelagomonas_calceolata.AAC.4
MHSTTPSGNGAASTATVYTTAAQQRIATAVQGVQQSPAIGNRGRRLAKRASKEGGCSQTWVRHVTQTVLPACNSTYRHNMCRPFHSGCVSHVPKFWNPLC